MRLRCESKGVSATRGARRSMSPRRMPVGAAARSSATSVGSPDSARRLREARRRSRRRPRRGRRRRSGPQTSRTSMRPVVRVPVLSVQITVVQPRVSTDDSRRTSAFRAAMRCTPRARAMVTMAGSPSGTAATASETEASTTSSQRHAAQRGTSANTTATTARHRTSSVRPSACELPLQRRLGRSAVDEQAGDVAHLRPHPRRLDDGDAAAGGHRGAAGRRGPAARPAARPRARDRRPSRRAGSRRSGRTRSSAARAPRPGARPRPRCRPPRAAGCRPRRPRPTGSRPRCPSRRTRARGALSARRASTARCGAVLLQRSRWRR